MSDNRADMHHSEADYAAFVDRNIHKFLPKFESFRMDPGGFHPSWNWAAFFFSFWWFLYRKMYMWAVICFLTLWLPYFNLLIWIGWAVMANGLYYRHANVKISEVKLLQGEQFPIYLRDAGSVNAWVPWVGFLVSGGFFVLAVILGLLGFAFMAGTSWFMFPDGAFFQSPPAEIAIRPLLLFFQ